MKWEYSDLVKWNDTEGNIPNVIILNINHNGLTVLPQKIFKLISLQKLHCSFNNIKSLPKEIGQLTSLREFYCYYNQVPILPKEIGLLISLQVFYCQCNKITILPKEIGLLASLLKFDCSFNNITTIPKEIGLLTSLQEITCYNNPLKQLKLTRDQNNLQEVREYFEAYEVKLVRAKRIIALLKIQRFISHKVIPKYYNTKGPINLSI